MLPYSSVYKLYPIPYSMVKGKKISAFTPRKVEFTDEGKVIYWTKSRKIISDNPRVKQAGQIQLKIKFNKKGRNSITLFGYSSIYDLSDRKELGIAKMEAFKSAYKDVPFSPDSFNIIGERFIYVETLVEGKYIDSREALMMA